MRLITDLYSSDPKTFLHNYYKLRVVEESLVEYNNKGYSLLGDDYCKLYVQFTWNNKKCQVKKFKDGEKRRKRLYIDSCLIRKIYPDINFSTLLYNMVNRRFKYYDNSDLIISNKFLIDLVVRVMKEDLSVISQYKTKHGKFKTDKQYCVIHNLNVRSYSCQIRGDLNRESIGEWYDCSKSVQENYKFAKSENIKVCINTLKRFCKENNIDMNPNKKPINEWFNPDKSINENLLFAKNNNIKVAKSSLYKYCKENNIKTK